MIKRLHLGASRLEKLTSQQLEVFLDRTWLHLGEEKLENPNNKPLILVDYSQINFKSFYFRKGDKLNFKQNYFDHIFSEHFFEHLFLDESIELFREIYRILKPKGVMRTVVPDADLRPVPEKIGFPGDQYSWSSQRKHKTRWSRYSLLPVLELTGFKVIPLRYYDKEGNLYNQIDNLPLPDHNRLLDIQILSEIRHIKRKNSLIVDAVK
jgi:predicted SAM-dependent methyltransferase